MAPPLLSQWRDMLLPSSLHTRLLSPAAVAAGLVAAFVTWLVCWQPFSADEPPVERATLECLLTASHAGSYTVRTDEGHGFVSNRPAQLMVSFPASATPLKVGLPLPPGRIRALRLTFVGNPQLAISGLQIRATGGRTLASFNLSHLKTVAGTSAALQEGRLLIHSESRPVLGLEVAPPTPLDLPSGNEPWLLEIAGVFLLTFALLLGLPAVVTARFPECAFDRGRRISMAIGAGAARQPVLTICAVGLFSGLWSCAPIVLKGASFVAPANGAPLLYFGTPTLPGAPVEIAEDPKGTDVAAMVWQNVPYSALEHRAIFRDHEWPLWNRENGGGVPLLGQGLSMIGDPLHWLPILADGASWAWDAKFLLAKALFAAGIGLCAWQLTRQLGISSLLAASTAWIGFFAFRFNHPAFFGVCYAPWVLLPWLALRSSSDSRRAWGWAGALILADLMELNSGTVKEPSVLLLCVNGAGFLTILLQNRPLRARLRTAALLVWASVLFLLISAPSWLLFVDALRQAATVSEASEAFQQQPGLFLGFFDEIFSQDFTKLEQHTHPSVNALILCGVLWFSATWRRLAQDRTALALGLATLVPLVFAYGVVPPAWITAIPFLGNIQHIDNVFGCVLVILLPVLAASGLAHCWRSVQEPCWFVDWRRSLGIGASLLLLYLGFTQALPQHEVFGFKVDPPLHSSFYGAYAPALLAVTALFPLGLRWLRDPRFLFAGAGTVAVCLLVMHFRHGMYGATKFDGYVMNPKTGCDLVAQSPAIDRVQRRLTEPYRTFGLGYTLSPGYQALLGLEGICGPDPLANRPYRELCRAAGVPLDLDWRILVDSGSLPPLLPFMDMLNLRFYLREGSSPLPAGLSFVGRADLEILESKSAWPRAFFSSELRSYRRLEDLVQMLHDGDGQPFAAQLTDLPNTTAASAASREIVPARDYRRSTNSTAFTIAAPRAGTVVLCENFEAENFQVTINGVPASYFRVDHMYKGISLPSAGTFRICFTYLPRFFHLSLWLAALGGTLALLTPFALRLLKAPFARSAHAGDLPQPEPSLSPV